MRLLLHSIAAFLLVITVASCGPSNGTLTAADAWARPMPAGQNGAVYFMIRNDSKIDDQLLAVTSNIALAAEMHLSTMNEDGVMSMARQDSVEAPAGERVTFEPGGLHVMLIDLQQDLTSGETFPIVLSFQQAGDIALQVEVKASP